MNSEFRYVAEEIRRDIDARLARLGVLCRVFARGKTNGSIEDKIAGQPGKYSSEGRLIQDCVGVRIVLYFSEDLHVVKNILMEEYRCDVGASAIDEPQLDQFTVARCNLVRPIPEAYVRLFVAEVRGRPIDTTFEIQLRSVLSEGWHEVEHDLRYKCKAHWQSHDDLSRMLNGVLATLETSEWSMGRVFDALAYRQYKQRNWVGMLHTKLRVRVHPEVSGFLLGEMDADDEFAKTMFRMDRIEVIRAFYRFVPRVPMSLDSILFYWNFVTYRSERVLEKTPALMLEAFGKSEPEQSRSRSSSPVHS